MSLELLLYFRLLCWKNEQRLILSQIYTTLKFDPPADPSWYNCTTFVSLPLICSILKRYLLHFRSHPPQTSFLFWQPLHNFSDPFHLQLQPLRYYMKTSKWHHKEFQNHYLQQLVHGQDALGRGTMVHFIEEFIIIYDSLQRGRGWRVRFEGERGEKRGRLWL